MPGRGGLDLIKDLVVLHPGVKILVCSMHDEMLYAERALHAGAKGYLTKDSPGPVMLAAIRRVLGGGIYVSERLAARVLDAFAGAASARIQFAPGKTQRPGVRGLPAFWRRQDGQGNRRATQPEPKDGFGASRSHQGEDGVCHERGDDPAGGAVGGGRVSGKGRRVWHLNLNLNRRPEGETGDGLVECSARLPVPVSDRD